VLLLLVVNESQKVPEHKSERVEKGRATSLPGTKQAGMQAAHIEFSSPSYVI
jgi:hypothetical protein